MANPTRRDVILAIAALPLVPVLVGEVLEEVAYVGDGCTLHLPDSAVELHLVLILHTVGQELELKNALGWKVWIREIPARRLLSASTHEFDDGVVYETRDFEVDALGPIRRYHLLAVGDGLEHEPIVVGTPAVLHRPAHVHLPTSRRSDMKLQPRCWAAYLGLAMILATAPGCAALVRNPDTGEMEFSASGAAKDSRALALTVTAFADSIRPTNPGLADDLYAVSQHLEQVADALDLYDSGVGEKADVLEKIDGALALLVSVLEVALAGDPEKAQEIAPYIAAVRASLGIAAIYLPDDPELEPEVEHGVN